MKRWLPLAAAVAAASVAGFVLDARSRPLLERGVAADPARTPDCVYVGTPRDVIDRMLDLAKIRTEDLVYDLGCGDARMLVAAARRHGCRCVGYDINPVRVEESVANARRNGVADLVKVEEEDIFTVDVSKADTILLYLLPEMNKRLIPQLQKLRPGARVVSHDYAIEGIEEAEYVTMTSLEDGVKHYLYVYEAPIQKES